MSSQQQGVKVICRVRPGESPSCASVDVTSVPGKRTTRVQVGEREHRFALPAFGDRATTAEIFEGVDGPGLIADVVQRGKSGTVVAYGQSAAGKTHTLQGADGEGLLPRCGEALFAAIAREGAGDRFWTFVSVLEIRKDQVFDLLAVEDEEHTAPSSTKKSKKKTESGELALRANPRGGVQVAAAHKVRVKNVAQLAEAVATVAPSCSSSHVVVTLSLRRERMRSGKPGVVLSATHSKLVLVDLAASDSARAKAAKPDDATVVEKLDHLEDSKAVTKSLGALGTVLAALAANAKQVPCYRECKLTRLLEDSLGAVRLVLCVSPAADDAAETLAALRYGSRVVYNKKKAALARLCSPGCARPTALARPAPEKKNSAKGTPVAPRARQAPPVKTAPGAKSAKELTALLRRSGEVVTTLRKRVATLETALAGERDGARAKDAKIQKLEARLRRELAKQKATAPTIPKENAPPPAPTSKKLTAKIFGPTKIIFGPTKLAPTKIIFGPPTKPATKLATELATELFSPTKLAVAPELIIFSPSKLAAPTATGPSELSKSLLLEPSKLAAFLQEAEEEQQSLPPTPAAEEKRPNGLAEFLQQHPAEEQAATTGQEEQQEEVKEAQKQRLADFLQQNPAEEQAATPAATLDETAQELLLDETAATLLRDIRKSLGGKHGREQEDSEDEDEDFDEAGGEVEAEADGDFEEKAEEEPSVAPTSLCMTMAIAYEDLLSDMKKTHAPAFIKKCPFKPSNHIA